MAPHIRQCFPLFCATCVAAAHSRHEGIQDGTGTSGIVSQSLLEQDITSDLVFFDRNSTIVLPQVLNIDSAFRSS
ncbi:uncharacterized protein EV420DRAFT_211211 [Desarmillaria tabescens]|uniref:Uncharacterized protein n=1 Tax=Armillaria tabescens TaxID=1929756 RepID=A0AA39N7H6_ARMTA|nr:uncharacterized protein EV420DRAFT_211211 [Desarmillaria tabescens]KAK0460447.1 hypothetical protein EV420DRAFT_211211 [Desarmillaria tabescens]